MSEAVTSQERKAEIFRRIQAGERPGTVARAMGLSRQYVHYLVKQSEQAGVEATVALRRGRPTHKPLTATQSAELLEKILSKRPVDSISSTGLWPGREIKAWFKAKFGRSLSISELRRFCTENKLRLAPSAEALKFLLDDPEEPASAPSPAAESTADDPLFKTRRRGRPKRSEVSPTSVMTERMMEAIKKANAEAAEIMARARRDREAKLAAEKPTPVRLGPKLGRNDPCPVDSSKKFKNCCGATGLTRCVKQNKPADPSPGAAS